MVGIAPTKPSIMHSLFGHDLQMDTSISCAITPSNGLLYLPPYQLGDKKRTSICNALWNVLFTNLDNFIHCYLPLSRQIFVAWRSSFTFSSYLLHSSTPKLRATW